MKGDMMILVMEIRRHSLAQRSPEGLLPSDGDGCGDWEGNSTCV